MPDSPLQSATLLGPLPSSVTTAVATKRWLSTHASMVVEPSEGGTKRTDMGSGESALEIVNALGRDGDSVMVDSTPAKLRQV